MFSPEAREGRILFSLVAKKAAALNSRCAARTSAPKMVHKPSFEEKCPPARTTQFTAKITTLVYLICATVRRTSMCGKPHNGFSDGALSQISNKKSPPAKQRTATTTLVHTKYDMYDYC